MRSITLALLVLPYALGAQPRAFPQGPGQAVEVKLLKKFDRDSSGHLDAAERVAAREEARSLAATRRGPGGPGGLGARNAPPGAPPTGRGPGGGPGRGMPTGSAGPTVRPADVPAYTSASLYDPTAVRTIFLEFENADWEQELQEFHDTDVEVPATLTVDGRKYPGVGVSFRGASSYMMVPAGNKRSFGLSLDLVDSTQRWLGRKSLNLLNSNGDPSYLSSVLYSAIANAYLPAPRANHVQVVINGESWGTYANVEQFDADFVAEFFKVSGPTAERGARWKVPGSPNGRGGLDYLGDSLALYQARYEIKSRNRESDWRALVQLTRVLSETPVAQLESAVRPILDIEGTLRFLALDVVLMNSDGYWTRASDYNLYRDPAGVFHLVPHDMNEAFRAAGGGPGGRGPRGLPAPGGGPPPEPPPVVREGADAQAPFSLDPLVATDDPVKPLRSRLLAVPSLRARYLTLVREIATRSLDWGQVGPVVAAARERLDPLVRADTRKNSTYDAFVAATGDNGTLRSFFDGRRKFLMEWEPKS